MISKIIPFAIKRKTIKTPIAAVAPSITAVAVTENIAARKNVAIDMNIAHRRE
jgi:hypothetical protein